MSLGVVASAVAGPLIGGLLGGSEGGKGQQSTQRQELDPRIAQYLYGSNGSTGLLGHTNNTLQQQMAQGGLNGMQTAGLEMQRQALTDPRYTQGFDQMRSMGSSLMSGGVAGNPFTNGTMGANGQMRPQQQMPQQPPQGYGQPQQPQQPQQGATGAAYQPIQAPAPYTPPPPPPAQASAMDMDAFQQYLRDNRYMQYDRESYGGGGK